MYEGSEGRRRGEKSGGGGAEAGGEKGAGQGRCKFLVQKGKPIESWWGEGSKEGG